MTERKLPDGWRWVRFGDVVREVKDTTKDPEADGFERVVGLGHLDPESLPLRRWDELSELGDGTSFTRIFRAGQVLFGKRRAYQRKVAVADFDGICSSDILVFEPSSEELIPEFLPYLVQSDGFFDHALGTSAGSLSPRTKFKELAKYEFALPPLPRQSAILELLKAAHAQCEALTKASQSLADLRMAVAERTLFGQTEDAPADLSLGELTLPTGWHFERADEVCAAPVVSGITPRRGEVDASLDFPFIKVGNLRFDGSLVFSDTDSHLNEEAFDASRPLHVVSGDVLTNIVGPPLGKVSVVPVGMKPALINQAIVRFRPADDMWRVWLSSYLMTRRVKNWLLRRSKKTSGQRNINATTCANMPVPVPPLAEMDLIVSRLAEIEGLQAALTSATRQTESLGKALRQALLRGTS